MFVTALALLTVTACDDDEPIQFTEREVITTVQISFLQVDDLSTTTFQFADTDGPGGGDPIVDEVQLKADTEYLLEIFFLDQSQSATMEDITAKVLSESSTHLVCFSASGEMAQPSISDMDTNGNPLGLLSELTTGAAGMGSLQISLKHEPDKAAASACSTGETDVEVTFPVVIE